MKIRRNPLLRFLSMITKYSSWVVYLKLKDRQTHYLFVNLLILVNFKRFYVSTNTKISEKIKETGIIMDLSRMYEIGETLANIKDAKKYAEVNISRIFYKTQKKL